MPFFSIEPEDAKRGINWTTIAFFVVGILGVFFGVQQCRQSAITRGDLEARADSLKYWRDQAGTEHAKVGQLITSQAFAQKMFLDSLKLIKGAKPTAVTTVGIKGQEVLKPIGVPLGKPDWPEYWSPVLDQPGTYIWVDTTTTRPDTSTYVLSAADTLDWLKHSTRTYATKWDTVRVTYDSATLVVYDKLHIVESRVKEGGLFNRRLVPYVDVYHENPAIRSTGVKAWRVSVPVRHWGIGPAVNLYPRWNSGIKFGASFGLSLVYTAITF